MLTQTGFALTRRLIASPTSRQELVPLLERRVAHEGGEVWIGGCVHDRTGDDEDRVAAEVSERDDAAIGICRLRACAVGLALAIVGGCHALDSAARTVRAERGANPTDGERRAIAALMTTLFTTCDDVRVIPTSSETCDRFDRAVDECDSSQPPPTRDVIDALRAEHEEEASACERRFEVEHCGATDTVRCVPERCGRPSECVLDGVDIGVHSTAPLPQQLAIHEIANRRPAGL